MNKLISDLVGIINGFLAVFFIVVGVVVGSYADQVILGFLLGLSVSIVICGAIATVITIKDTAISMNKSLIAMREDINLSLILHKKISDSISSTTVSNSETSSDTTVSNSDTFTEEGQHRPKSNAEFMKELLDKKKKNEGSSKE